MHIDYAAEAFKRMTQPQHGPALNDRQTVESLVSYPEFLALTDKISDEKINSIAQTVRNAQKSKYAKVTAAQKYTLANALIAQHGSALSVYAQAFGKTQDEFTTLVASV